MKGGLLCQEENIVAEIREEEPEGQTSLPSSSKQSAGSSPIAEIPNQTGYASEI